MSSQTTLPPLLAAELQDLSAEALWHRNAQDLDSQKALSAAIVRVCRTSLGNYLLFSPPRLWKDPGINRRLFHALRRHGRISGDILYPITASTLEAEYGLGGLALLEAFILDRDLPVFDLPEQRPTSHDIVHPELVAQLELLIDQLQALEPSFSRIRGNRRLSTLADPALGSVTSFDGLRSWVSHVQGPLEADAISFRLSRLIEGLRAELGNCLCDELRSDLHAVGISDAHSQIVLARLGIRGDQPQTLQAVGDSFGITRERVRQIMQKASVLLSDRESPRLDSVCRTLQAMIPCRELDAQNVIRLDGSCELSVEAFLSLVTFRDPTSQWTSTDGRLFADRASVELHYVHRQRAQKKLATVLDRKGIISIEEAKRTGDSKAAVLDILDFPDVQLLGTSYVTRRDGAKRLSDVIMKILSVAGSIDVLELLEGISRHSRHREFKFSQEALTLYVSDILQFTIADSTVYPKSDDIPSWRDALGSEEQKLVDILFQYGPILTLRELRQLAVHKYKMSSHSVNVYIYGSPVLKLFAPQVVGLRGYRPSAGELAVLVEQTTNTAGAVNMGYSWLSARRVAIDIQLSEGVIFSGRLSLPSGLHEVLDGDFSLTLSGRATSFLVRAKSGYLSRLKNPIQSSELRAGDYVRITFDLDLASVDVCQTLGE